jgi:hypothetical protein
MDDNMHAWIDRSIVLCYKRLHMHDYGARMHVYTCCYLGLIRKTLRLLSWISICLPSGLWPTNAGKLLPGGRQPQPRLGRILDSAIRKGGFIGETSYTNRVWLETSAENTQQYSIHAGTHKAVVDLLHERHPGRHQSIWPPPANFQRRLTPPPAHKAMSLHQLILGHREV